MFSDGTLVAYNNSIGAIAGTPSANSLLLGKREDGDARGFAMNGMIDEVAFWNRALTDAELVYLYNSGKGNAVVEGAAIDVTTGFSSVSNPNPPFSYGYYTGSTFSLLPYSDSSQNFGCWYSPSGGPFIDWTGVPISDNYYWPANVLRFDPSYSAIPTVLRFTASRTGTYSITGYFIGLDNATTDVHITANMQQDIFSDYINGRADLKGFSISQTLNHGEFVNFVVGSNGNIYSDATGLAATITEIVHTTNIIDATYGIGAGSFELGVFVNGGGITFARGPGYMGVAPGDSTTITGWTVGGPDVHAVHVPVHSDRTDNYNRVYGHWI
ncbi:MAG: hypothetical protein ACMUIU_00220 [bacterium]